MARYSSSINKAGVNSATTTYVNLWLPTNRGFIREIGISVTTAPSNAQDWYLVRATARGTQTATQAGTALTPDAASSTGTVDNTWSGNPTVGAATAALRRFGLPVTAGSGIIWTFAKGDLEVSNSNGLAIVNANASGGTLGAFTFYFDWEE